MDATTPPFLQEKSELLSFSGSSFENNEKVPTMQSHSRITLLNVLKLCSKKKNLHKVRRIHAELIEQNLIGNDCHIATAFITTYAKCGAMEEAREVFEKIRVRNVVSWSVLISGYIQNGLSHEALRCFKRMRDDSVCADAITYVSVLKACGIVRSLEIGEYVDLEVRKQGLLEKDIILGNALADMYSKCGALQKAREVFDQLRVRDVISWSSLISGYVQQGLGHEALQCFQEMQDTGVCPNALTYISVSKACGIHYRVSGDWGKPSGSN